MRAQSPLGIIARTSHEASLGVMIAIVRIVFGATLVMMGANISSLFDPSCFWPPVLINSADACGGFGFVGSAGLLWIGRGLPMLGLFVRPVAIITTLAGAIFLLAELFGVTALLVVQLDSVSWLMLAVSAMLVAGGSGNVYGLNGLIYRNMRRHTWLSRFFLG